MNYNFFDIERTMQDEFSLKKYYKLQKDHLKKKKFVFARYPLVTKYSVEINDLRAYIYADAYSRYLTHLGNDVLFTVGINNTSKKLYENVSSKVLSKEDPYTSLKEKSYIDLYSMDIGYDQGKSIESHSKEFISFIQDCFINISRTKFIRKIDEQYYLDISSIKEELIEQLQLNNMYEHLKPTLKYTSGIKLTLQTSISDVITTIVEKPELLGGVNFIAMSPKYHDAEKFYLDSEKEFIHKALRNRNTLGVYSGNFVLNPINGKEIPILISRFFDEEIHLGIPSDNDKDLFFSGYFGIEFDNVLKDNILINSGFLDNLLQEEAKEVMIKAMIDENIGELVEDIELDYLLISEEFNDGISLPCHDDVVYNESSLPILIDSKNNVRTINNVLTKQNITNQVFNKYITQAFLSISCRQKTKIGIIKMSSSEFNKEYIDFQNIDYGVFYSLQEYLYTLILNIIVCKMKNISIEKIFNKIYIEGSLFDRSGRELLRENNNLVDLQALLKKYGSCSLRMNMLSTKLRDNYYYNNEDLLEKENFIHDFCKIFRYNLLTENKDLDKLYQETISECNKLIEDNNMPEYINKIVVFVNKVNKIKKISRKQAKGILILFNIVAPSICEQINKDYFKSNYPLIFDAWVS